MRVRAAPASLEAALLRVQLVLAFARLERGADERSELARDRLALNGVARLDRGLVRAFAVRLPVRPARAMAVFAMTATLDEPAGAGIDAAAPIERQGGAGRVQSAQNERQAGEQNDKQSYRPQPSGHAGRQWTGHAVEALLPTGFTNDTQTKWSHRIEDPGDALFVWRRPSADRLV